ncbi:hypothetical protein PAQ31011_00772 [Pandoraea aquatica]|uniref:ABC transporter permease n=1 Tax=Pandoraea aquatica TaxID=2508290 RepID=A0A5E4SEK9_9BURK|nr:hypothetical protein [Pandoraea aquatica]VVD74097.1 hypothetical protein PAQ31011_00772 [Pandoraea aquatica]
MSGRSDPAAVGILFIGGMIAFGVFSLSKSLGADFQATFFALFGTVVVVGLCFLAAFWLNWSNHLAMLSGAAAAIWPQWWPVLKSMSEGGQSIGAYRNFSRMYEPAWYAEWWVQWPIEIALIGLCAWRLYADWNEYRY